MKTITLLGRIVTKMSIVGNPFGNKEIVLDKQMALFSPSL